MPADFHWAPGAAGNDLGPQVVLAEGVAGIDCGVQDEARQHLLPPRPEPRRLVVVGLPPCRGLGPAGACKVPGDPCHLHSHSIVRPCDLEVVRAMVLFENPAVQGVVEARRHTDAVAVAGLAVHHLDEEALEHGRVGSGEHSRHGGDVDLLESLVHGGPRGLASAPRALQGGQRTGPQGLDDAFRGLGRGGGRGRGVAGLCHVTSALLGRRLRIIPLPDPLALGAIGGGVCRGLRGRLLVLALLFQVGEVPRIDPEHCVLGALSGCEGSPRD
mmetsp:Transcript_69240/g.219087  ORF Transcript_69240/g.219087 Transcript_69240/m.219087 type:complete len:272 (-) Transcript_69240:227-1042(-)